MQFVRPLLGAATASVLLLSGCSLFPSGESTPAPTNSEAAPTPTESAPAGDGTFAVPSDCLTILPKSQVDSYANENIVLLAGPGGIYGGELVPDPTPEMLEGGISCYFGYDNDDPNQIQIYSVVSAAPVSAANRETIAETLLGQGLNEGANAAGYTTFSILGDTDANVPAMFNVISDDSWISVISVFGGEAFFEENVAIAELVRDQVYN
jgi:hypothetical protein